MLHIIEYNDILVKILYVQEAEDKSSSKEKNIHSNTIRCTVRGFRTTVCMYYEGLCFYYLFYPLATGKVGILTLLPQ